MSSLGLFSLPKTIYTINAIKIIRGEQELTNKDQVVRETPKGDVFPVVLNIIFEKLTDKEKDGHNTVFCLQKNVDNLWITTKIYIYECNGLTELNDRLYSKSEYKVVEMIIDDSLGILEVNKN